MVIANVSDRSIAELISLEGRSAVVTGGAQGLGKAMARRLAEAGAAVIIGDLKLEAAQEAADELSQRYGSQVIATRFQYGFDRRCRAAWPRGVWWPRYLDQ
jgi:NAD(P)-dependent dehydrogenase (short-subunit alcohol dehydrogenase family)